MMIATVGLIILWFIGFAFVLVACTAILNISLNISLIADSKIQGLKLNQSITFEFQTPHFPLKSYTIFILYTK
jgi:hypothetical protein